MWPLKLCGSDWRQGTGFLRDAGALNTFGAGSLRSGGCIRFGRWEQMRCADCRLQSRPQSSFLLFSRLCTEVKKSTMSLAVFLGFSITTECPQFSRSSTWQLAIDLAKMSAPDTLITCKTREGTTWKRFRYWVHSVDRTTETWFGGPSHLSVRAYGSLREVTACCMFYTATQCQAL